MAEGIDRAALVVVVPPNRQAFELLPLLDRSDFAAKEGRHRLPRVKPLAERMRSVAEWSMFAVGAFLT
jgi:hypothetical protein